MAVKALYMSNGDLGLARAQLAKLLPKLFEADNEKVRQRIEQRHVRKEEEKVLSDYLDERNYKQLPPLTDVAKVELLREMGSDPNVDASAPAFQTEKKWWWAGGEVAPEHPRELVHHRLRTSFEEATASETYASRAPRLLGACLTVPVHRSTRCAPRTHEERRCRSASTCRVATSAWRCK